jgi:hypothetical protein
MVPQLWANQYQTIHREARIRSPPSIHQTIQLMKIRRQSHIQLVCSTPKDVHTRKIPEQQEVLHVPSSCGRQNLIEQQKIFPSHFLRQQEDRQADLCKTGKKKATPKR